MQNLTKVYLMNALKCSRFQILQQFNQTRKAGHYKRTPSTVMKIDQLQELKTNVFQARTELSAEEWQETRQALLNNNKFINNNNIDAVILGVCNDAHQLPLAKNYMQYINENGMQLNAASLGRLLRVYNAAYHARGALTTEEQKEILQIYAEFREKHSVLDATSCENLIHGLVATQQWSDCMELLEMCKLTTQPSVAAYTEVVMKAFSEAQMETGWRLLEEMVTQGKQPKCEAWIAYLNAIAKSKKDFAVQMEPLLEFLEKHELVITEKVVGHMEAIAGTEIQLCKTTLNRFGKCAACGSSMQNITISDEEFTKLSDAFLNRVLIRRDVFLKSTPEELEQFKQYVAKTAPYDCVIDGLNVAYSMGAKKPPQTLAKLLAAVVQNFNEQNKHVLVLGRKHMNKWPAKYMQYVRTNASVFLTNNLSHDDPFMLYATIKSGATTDFFSRDLMRAHAHLLGGELKQIFRRWQQEHQYSLVTQTASGRIIVKEPIRHRIYAHKVEQTWHLPYKQAYSANPAETFEMCEHWLCLKLQNQTK